MSRPFPQNPATLIKTRALDAHDALLPVLAAHIGVVTAAEHAAHEEQRQAHEDAKAEEADLRQEYSEYLEAGDTAIPGHEWPAAAPSFGEWKLMRSQGDI